MPSCVSWLSITAGPSAWGYLVGRGHAARAPGMEHAFGDRVSTGRTAREALGEGTALPVEAVGWEHSVDEAPGRKRFRRQDGGREHHLRCASCADP